MTDNRELAMLLLKADSEQAAIKILKDAGYWDNPEAWRLYGDQDSNYSTIGNQQARPEAALAEKIVNSVDARLMGECLERGIDPESNQAPRSISHAISVLFDGKPFSSMSEGTISDWSQKKTTEEAKKITLAVTGNKPREGMPCITVVDNGEGQSPKLFPNTFMSINRANKLRIPFVQGKFNMGGTGALKFCGNHSLQLVISRRNPAIIKTWQNKNSRWTSSDSRNREWGFTIVRRERPTGTPGEVRNSIFRYLAPIPGHDGTKEVLSFDSDNIPMFPEGNKPYVRVGQHGTIIKLYEYDVKGFSSRALGRSGLLARLEALLPHVALPIRVHECRPYGGKEGSYSNNLVGLSVRLAENRGGNLEEGYPTTATFVARNEQMTARIYAFKGDRAESYRTNEGIIFSINGQTHGAIPKTFFSRSRVKMGRLARSLIILVDCSKMSTGAREDLFMNSRDRLSSGKLRKEIEEELEDIIGRNPGLKQLRERRREEEITNRLEESKPLEQVLNSIIKTSPALSRLFIYGQRLNRPNRAEKSPNPGGGIGTEGDDADFKSKDHPTYFHFHKKDPEYTLKRNAEINKRCRIKFETDVKNDYFEREHLRGSYELEVIDGPLERIELDHNLSLNNGIANWSIKLPDDRIAVGDTLTIQCTVTDETLLEPFVNVAVVTVTENQRHVNSEDSLHHATNTSGGERNNSGTGPFGHTGTNRASGTRLSGGISLPQTILVYRDDDNWKNHSFDDRTSCKVIEDEIHGQSVYTFYINADNVYLKTDMKENNENVSVQQNKFVWGNVLIGLALIHDAKQHPGVDSNNNADSDELNSGTVFSRLDRTTRALGPFLLPMIDYLGGITQDDVSVLITRGYNE